MDVIHHIVVQDLVKTYRVATRRAGLLGALMGVVRPKYRMVRALEGISFSVEPGELIGYIGPNGAGKSTTIKILSGILVPDSGTCTVLGKVPWRDRVSYVSRIGVVFGQRTQLWWDLPVIDSLDLLRDIYRVPASDYRANRDELVDLLNLSDLLDVPVRQLSLGQRMRCDLAASLIHGPSLVFLDEPTIGLDAVSKLAVRDFIRRLHRERGTTVILTTHDMADIEALCSRVMVIGGGRILFDGTLDGLRASVSRERRLIIELPPGSREHDLNLPASARVVEREGRQIHISFDPDLVTPAQLINDISSRTQIQDLYVVNPPIDEIISEIYGEMGL